MTGTRAIGRSFPRRAEIRRRAAQIRRDWTPDEYLRRREMARLKQQWLFGSRAGVAA